MKNKKEVDLIDQLIEIIREKVPVTRTNNSEREAQTEMKNRILNRLHMYKLTNK